MPQFEEFCADADLIRKAECAILFGDFPNINDCNECDKVGVKFFRKKMFQFSFYNFQISL